MTAVQVPLLHFCPNGQAGTQALVGGADVQLPFTHDWPRGHAGLQLLLTLPLSQ